RSIKRANNFRKEIKKLNKANSGWYFDIWQPDVEIEDPECWELKNSDTWHGFKNQDDNHIYLDPIKVTVLTPGITNNQIDDFGIPANIIAMYLDEHGVIVEKTGPYTLLFLFSIGINRPKSMKLITILNNFKIAFDKNQYVKDIIPSLYNQHPEFYKNMRIQDLACKVHSLMKKYRLTDMMYKAFDCLPEVEMTPHQAFQRLIKGKTKLIKLDELEGNISAVMILPYPPGVPLIMPGEKITKESRAVLDYLIMLEKIGLEVPGFETDIHGLEKDENNQYMIKIIN
ncbi:MAG: lysine decarboxylase LdcC, partial [Burkholderiales bacterium]|nr:lysine decarboxylase LdcC [Burkholderiales bacterium]